MLFIIFLDVVKRFMVVTRLRELLGVLSSVDAEDCDIVDDWACGLGGDGCDDLLDATLWLDVLEASVWVDVVLGDTVLADVVCATAWEYDIEGCHFVFIYCVPSSFRTLSL